MNMYLFPKMSLLCMESRARSDSQFSGFRSGRALRFRATGRAGLPPLSSDGPSDKGIGLRAWFGLLEYHVYRVKTTLKQQNLILRLKKIHYICYSSKYSICKICYSSTAIIYVLHLLKNTYLMMNLVAKLYFWLGKLKFGRTRTGSNWLFRASGFFGLLNVGLGSGRALQKCLRTGRAFGLLKARPSPIF